MRGVFPCPVGPRNVGGRAVCSHAAAENGLRRSRGDERRSRGDRPTEWYGRAGSPLPADDTHDGRVTRPAGPHRKEILI